MNTQELELLKKEIAYRASRRGTKELDAKFKPFSSQETLATFSPNNLLLLKELMLETEDVLMGYLVEGGELPNKYALLLKYL